MEKDLDEQGCVLIDAKSNGKKYHYLKSVLRVSVGDMIYARLTDGSLQQMTVAKLDEKQIVLQVAGERAGVLQEEDSVKAAPIASASGVELWLFMFVAKPPKMELIIRQAAECGVSVIVPVKGTFCQKSSIESALKRAGSGAEGSGSGKKGDDRKGDDRKSDDRWDRIITEALQQSGSPVQTKVLGCMDIQEACDLWHEKCGASGDEESSVAVVLYEQTKGTKTLHEAVNDCLKNADTKITRACVAVGAEGGVSPQEIELMQGNGFTPVHFATNILRCETAALYGMAALQTVLMEKEKWQYKE